MLFLGKDVCLICKDNKSIDGNYICSSCMELFEIVQKKEDLKLAYVKEVYYSLLYNKFMRENLHKFKFQGKSYLHKPFGEILIRTIKTQKLDEKIQGIIYVPSHRRKKARRGYNQSELLASYIGKELDIPLLKNNIKKVKATKDQNKLGKTERRRNLKNCFAVRNERDFKDQNLLLIDDIITTGTTIEECSRVLINNGAKKLYALTITSGKR